MGAVGVLLSVGQIVVVKIIVAVENTITVGIAVVPVETGILGSIGILEGVDHAVAIGILR